MQDHLWESCGSVVSPDDLCWSLICLHRLSGSSVFSSGREDLRCRRLMLVSCHLCDVITWWEQKLSALKIVVLSVRLWIAAVGSLVVRASDSRPEGLGSMLDVTKYLPSAHGFTFRNCGGGDRGRVAIYRPFGEFHRAYIALSPVWCSRPTTGVPLAHATTNFVGLVLTTSDRWN
ncbi:uncharacterized protein TNCV_3356721 [Trichonephila clavipes]|nr:uncharacterized protein TNCV_3356721 [Trichonephila clavipes]